MFAAWVVDRDGTCSASYQATGLGYRQKCTVTITPYLLASKSVPAINNQGNWKSMLVVVDGGDSADSISTGNTENRIAGMVVVLK